MHTCQLLYSYNLNLELRELATANKLSLQNKIWHISSAITIADTNSLVPRATQLLLFTVTNL